MEIGPVRAHVSELLALLEPALKTSLEQKKLASVHTVNLSATLSLVLRC